MPLAAGAGPGGRFVAAVTGYRQEGLPAGVHRGLPSPYLTLVVTVDEPLLLAGRSAGCG